MRLPAYCFPLQGGFRRVLLAALVTACILAATHLGAAARGFSALVVDAYTGELLYSQSPDDQRHPASLTKVMTLYVLFEELEAGRMTLATKLKVSRHAASRPPSRLGLKAGGTISVENAIKALITRSANDVAAAIGESISGSETAFATRMTKTARAIGMTRTTFRNASGLPNPAQVTTARDMATLGLRIQRDFPRYYPYFSLRSFTYEGRLIRTHNRLLGRYKGADGIKTGYIRASGFNLTTSAARGGKRVVGVVMGSNSPGARNQYMTKMLDKYFGKAKTSRKSTIAALAGNPPGVALAAVAELSAPTPAAIAAGPSGPAQLELVPASESAVAVPAVPVASKVGATEQVAAPAGGTALQASDETAGVITGDSGPDSESSDAGENDAEWPKPASLSKQDNHATAASAAPLTSSSASAGDTSNPTAIASLDDASAPASAPGSADKTGWKIQVGAYPSARDARRRLDEVRALKIASLHQKLALAIPVSKGKSTLYRARFLGFSEKTAKETCRQLTKRGVGCLTLAPQG
jgi:D-alanyl-D-alanine carboxypeptidase